METFTREIEFLSNTFDGEKAIQIKVKKTATFKELSQTDKKQHDLHFDILGLFLGNRKEEKGEDGEVTASFQLNMPKVRQLVVESIKTLLIVDPNFTETDKVEFLQDSGALLKFSMWFMSEKATPFFQTLNLT